MIAGYTIQTGAMLPADKHVVDAVVKSQFECLTHAIIRVELIAFGNIIQISDDIFVALLDDLGLPGAS